MLLFDWLICFVVARLVVGVFMFLLFGSLTLRTSNIYIPLTKCGLTDCHKCVPETCYLLRIITLIYSAIPRKNLQARAAVHYQHQNPLDNQKSTTTSTIILINSITINAYINIKMSKMPG